MRGAQSETEGAVLCDAAPNLTHIMNKSISLALFVGGVILIVYGAAASDSIGSAFSRLFTGAPTDKTLWMLIGGAVAAVVGGVGLMGGSKSS